MSKFYYIYDMYHERINGGDFEFIQMLSEDLFDEIYEQTETEEEQERMKQYADFNDEDFVIGVLESAQVYVYTEDEYDEFIRMLEVHVYTEDEYGELNRMLKNEEGYTSEDIQRYIGDI